MFDFGFLDVIHIGLLVLACLACYVAGKINGAANIVSELIDDKIVTLDRLERWVENKNK